MSLYFNHLYQTCRNAVSRILNIDSHNYIDRHNFVKQQLNDFLPNDLVELTKMYDYHLDGKVCKILRGHESSIICIQVLPDQRLVTLDNDATIRIWDIKIPGVSEW